MTNSVRRKLVPEGLVDATGKPLVVVLLNGGALALRWAKQHAAGRTYRYFQGVPLLSFGFGLSYSHFRYSDTRLRTGQVRAGASLVVDTTVTIRVRAMAMKSSRLI